MNQQYHSWQRTLKKKMASPISCLSILIIPLLVTSLFYDVSNVDRALIESVCKNSMDYDFCVSALLSDPNSITTILYRLRLISTILNLEVIEDSRGEIRNLLIQFKDPLDRLEFWIAKPIYRGCAQENASCKKCCRYTIFYGRGNYIYDCITENYRM